MTSELVYVVPRDVVFGGREGWFGVHGGDPDGVLALIATAGEFIPRSEAEQDASRKQIIPYLILRDADRIFLMHRTKAGGDARLHDLYSVGVGGHLNPGDGDVLGCLRREWREEIEAGFEPEFEFVGLLNDDTVAVGQVHLGVVYTADAAGRPVAIRERDKLDGSFERLPRLREVFVQMETWSQLALEYLLATEPFAPPGSRTNGR